MRTGSAKAIWLHILANGVQDANDIAIEFPALGNKARSLLHAMAVRHGQLERTEGRPRAVFVVTPRCAVPVGVTLAEVLEAVR